MLITRPQAEAADTAARVEKLGFRAVLAPSLRLQQRPVRLSPGVRPQAILLTSGNALASLPSSLHGTRLLAVGDASAERARAAGFADVHSAGRDAVALAELAEKWCSPGGGPLLLPAGAGQGGKLADCLRARGFAVLRRVAYAAWPISTLPEAARQALAGESVAAVLFFSAASARGFAAAVRRGGLAKTLLRVEAVAISQATADALSLLPWRSIRVASKPDQDGLMEWLR